MTALTDWLFDKTPSETDDAPEIPEHLRASGHLPEVDDGFEAITEPIDLEEVYTIMDYRDSTGAFTRRRVTFRKISPGPHAPLLQAICHERRAVRCFRCDRIEGFIEDTGEVISCADFFLSIMDIDLTKFQNTAGNKVATALSEARRIRDELRPPLSILVALARSDDLFAQEELNVICDWVRDAAPEVELAAHPGETPTITELRPIIRRLRPTRQSLGYHLSKMGSMGLLDPGPQRDRFETALNQVLWADGKIAEGEKIMLRELGLA